jgi:glycosyltransferase involved in cell wall biosynthesis
MPISVLVLTFNEEVNIRRCLKSVAWADDVVVLDSGSTDRTVAIAESMGARVLQRSFDDFAGQRNWGLENAGFRHDWVLHLDADEVVPPEMHDEILGVIRDNRFAGYRVSLKLMFQDRWIRRASMFPAYQVRLGRRDRLRFKMEGHGQRENLPPGEIGTLETSLLHYSFEKGLTDWFEKHNRYSSAEAAENVRRRSQGGGNFRALFSLDRGTRFRAMKQLASRLPFRPLLRFLYMAFIRRGLLDGIPGLHYCMLVVIYEYMIVLKEKEILQREQRLAEEGVMTDTFSTRVPPQGPTAALALSGDSK